MCSGSAGRLSGRTCDNDASAAGAPCAPNSGDIDGRTMGYRWGHDSVAADVVQLSCQPVPKSCWTLAVHCIGVGRVELGGQHNVLRLSKDGAEPALE